MPNAPQFTHAYHIPETTFVCKIATIVKMVCLVAFAAKLL